MAVERKEIEQALAESLKHLVLQVPFEKITIRQITKITTAEITLVRAAEPRFKANMINPLF